MDIDSGIVELVDTRAHAPGTLPVRRRLRLWWILALIGVLAWAGWRYGMPRPVDGLVVVPAPFAITVSGPGLLDALVRAEVSARVQGRIVDLPVDQNDTLTAGALVARLDAPDTVQQLSQTRADAEAQRLAVSEAENDRLSAKAGLIHAQLDYDRKAALLRTSDAPRADYDTARAALDQATASLARAEAGVRHAVASANAAQAAAAVVEARLADSTVSAPFSGIVTVRTHSLGDILTPGESIVEMVDPRSIIISARMDESVMGGLAPGQAAAIRFAAFPDRLFAGQVLRLGRSVDVTTREFTIDVTPSELPPHWAMGQRSFVTVTTAVHANAIAVPMSALAPRDGQTGVWIAADGHRAMWRPVRLGAASFSLVEVVQGLGAGETVLLDPATLYTLEPVRVTTSPAARP